MWIRLRQNSFHFGNRDDRQESQEEQEIHQEEPKTPDKRHDIDPRRVKHVPSARYEVTRQGSDDNHKSLEPHPSINEVTDEEDDKPVLPHFFKPENLGRYHVAEHHGHVRPDIRTVLNAQHEGIQLKLVAAIPSNKQFTEVRVTHDRPGQQNDLCHVVDVLPCQQVLKTIDFADGEHESQHHGESTEDGASDEVRREDGGMPARNDGSREVERNDGVHRKHQRCREGGQQQVRHFVMVPLAVPTAPSQREQSIESFFNAGFAAVAYCPQIRNQSEVPEKHRHREVRRNGEHVPKQR